MTGILPAGMGMRVRRLGFTTAMVDDDGMEGFSTGMRLGAFAQFLSRPAPYPMACLDKRMDILYRSFLMSVRSLPSFISRRVIRGRYLFLDLDPPATEELAVIFAFGYHPEVTTYGLAGGSRPTIQFRKTGVAESCP
jgi:hypothetical protein